MRPGLFLLTAFACASCLAQTVQESPPLEAKKNQKIEHLHAEDSAVKIDEVRYAGQTQSITVQPKDGMPAYEIQPVTPARQRTRDDGRSSAGGERVWNVLAF
jgi:hypothetical protein